MKIHIKYMICNRCKAIVRAELDKLGIHYCMVELGEVDLREPIDTEQRRHLQARLLKCGLELMDDKKSIVIEKIKHIIIEMIHNDLEVGKVTFSELISKKMHQDYGHLSGLFSEVTGYTIEHYIILNKIERVKELLLYDELNLTEISYNLGYSSVAHLSHQFKRVTGLTPTYFKQLKLFKKRIVLENL